MKNNKLPPLYLLLASMSRYRAQCLQKLQVPFEQWAPHIDETALDQETPQALVLRLAVKKAQAGHAALHSVKNPNSISHIIGSDQVMCAHGQTIGKPHTENNAIAQLTSLSGQRATFWTSLCVLEVETQQYQTSINTTYVDFRHLNATQIKNYVRMEQPFDCAGSFKSERAGIVLCKNIEGQDPNALIGLPLIALTNLLDNLGYQLPLASEISSIPKALEI